MTVEVVARFSGRELLLDEGLEQRIYAILEPLMKRFRHWDPEAMKAANRKQALIPEGATVIDPVGTAPGVIVPGNPVVVVLPGPPRELQPMWRVAVESEPVQGAIAARTEYDQSTVRMFGLPESGLAETLREAEREVDGFERLEITTCLRRGEIEMVTRYEPDAEAAYDEPDEARPRAPSRARSSPRTARASTTWSPSCWPAAGSRPPSPAPPASWPRGSPTGRVPRRTWRAASWHMRTRRRRTCSASIRR